MKQKLDKLFYECIDDLNTIGINILNEKKYGRIEILVSKRNNKRYGCCKQEEPDNNYKTVIKKGFKRIIRYERFNKHTIEISPWVLQLEDSIIKDTIMHELIHCIPYCNNHGDSFKEYAKFINENLSYNITRVGNKKKDFERSNIVFKEKEKDVYKYRITCNNCNQEFYRQRIAKNFIKKYRCGKCKGKFEISYL